jgi:HAD superfamily hydrolase (TIGR01459 family)
LEKASFILNSGTHSFEDTIDNYLPLLKDGIMKNLPMVCPNPDQKVIYGSSFAICAGAIAKEYEKLGGSVMYYGKPYPEIFLKTLELCSTDTPLSKVLMVGDSLATDIKGANTSGIDSVFILSGIHQLKKEDALDDLFQKTSTKPTYFMERVELE